MHKTILVTGSPRGGTTAIGKMLSLGRESNMLYEPFNEDAGIVEITEPFTVPRSGVEAHIEGIMNLNLNYRKGLREGDTKFRRFIKLFTGSRGINTYRICRMNPFLKTIIWKDPVACFLSEYVAKEFDIDVLVTMRNPHAVSGSFKRLDMSYDLKGIYKKLVPVNKNIEELESYLDISQPAINSAILWNMIFSTLIKWSNNDRITFVNTEEILNDPVNAYEVLYNKLGLKFSRRTKNKIDKFHSSNRKKPRSSKSHDFNRSPESFNSYYDKILTKEEMQFITSLNGELWDSLKGLSILQNKKT